MEEEKGEVDETEDQLFGEEDGNNLVSGAVESEGGEPFLTPVQKGDPAFAEMEVEGSPHQVSLEVRREEGVTSTTPTRTPAQKCAVAERKWLDNLWSYDDNFSCDVEVGSHHDLLDGGLGNGEAFAMPTRTLPRK